MKIFVRSLFCPKFERDVCGMSGRWTFELLGRDWVVDLPERVWGEVGVIIGCRVVPRKWVGISNTVGGD